MFNTNQSSFKRLGQIVATNTSPLVAWVGAGLSAPAGLPSWPKLREKLTEAFNEKIKERDHADHQSLTAKLQMIRSQKDFWVAFGLLRENLGRGSYEATIRDALAIAVKAKLPPAYLSLWKLRLSGLLNLNLDGLAVRAFVEVHGSKQVVQFNGWETA